MDGCVLRGAAAATATTAVRPTAGSTRSAVPIRWSATAGAAGRHSAAATATGPAAAAGTGYQSADRHARKPNRSITTVLFRCSIAGQPDYSAQWAEYYRSLGMHEQASMIEQQAKAGGGAAAPQQQQQPAQQPQPTAVVPGAQQQQRPQV